MIKTLAQLGTPVHCMSVTEPRTMSGVAVEGPAVFYSLIIMPDPVETMTLDIRNGTGPKGLRLFPGNWEIWPDTDLDGVLIGGGLYCEHGIFVTVHAPIEANYLWQVYYADE